MTRCGQPSPCALPRVPEAFFGACQRHGVRPTRYLLVVHVARQSLHVFEREPASPRSTIRPSYLFRRRLLASTSRIGVGQKAGSHRTPPGLHRIAEKIGGGQPVGAVFHNRRLVGFTWQGRPTAGIVHRILWLEGLEPGLNRGASVDSHARYIYLHGVADETTLGQPASRGCIHLAAADLLPLFDQLPSGTLVWIQAGS